MKRYCLEIRFESNNGRATWQRYEPYSTDDKDEAFTWVRLFRTKHQTRLWDRLEKRYIKQENHYA